MCGPKMLVKKNDGYKKELSLDKNEKQRKPLAK